MEQALAIEGLGHVVGSQLLSNKELAVSLGLDDDWFTERTGIVERCVCGPDENVLTLAKAAVTAACVDANLPPDQIGSETVLIHIQNGLTSLTPPSGIVLANALGLNNVRVLAIDGVCAEPIAALEIAALMLSAQRCERVIVSAAVDFLPIIDPMDHATVGLFGAGAGAVILSTDGESAHRITLRSLCWQTHAALAGLGTLGVTGFERGPGGVSIKTGFYEMDGHGLARAALRFLPQLLSDVLGEAGWQRSDVGLVLAHQPNAKLLDIGIRALRLDPATVPMPVKHLGNMGPASLLVNLSLAAQEGRLTSGLKVLLVAFGLGFSCGAAALQW